MAQLLLARLERLKQLLAAEGLFVSARSAAGDDLAFVFSDWARGIEPWRFNIPLAQGTQPDTRAHTVFDRTLLRAGETVAMKHFVRDETERGLALPAAAQLPAEVVLTHVGSDTEFKLPLKWPRGARSAENSWSIPKNAPLGLYDVALLDLDRPLTTRSGNGGGGPGFDGTTFGFHLDGNPGQQVSVTRGTALDGWTQEEAFWLPAGGLNYRDPNAGAQPIGFYATREVPLTVVAEGTYTDGRRGWKVFGGRLGRSYVLESSGDGKLWTPVRTNRVAEGAYHHVSPAGGNTFLRVKP